jgi:hypothetical protein
MIPRTVHASVVIAGVVTVAAIPTVAVVLRTASQNSKR